MTSPGIRTAIGESPAFGAIEAISEIEFDQVQDKFSHELMTKWTSVPQALNVVTTVEVPKSAKFYYTDQKRRFPQQKIECAFTTLYNQQALLKWLGEHDFSVEWSKTFGGKSVLLIRKAK